MNTMKCLNLATALGVGKTGLSGWTCRRCTLQAQGQLKIARQIKGYATKAHKAPKPKKRTGVILAAAGGALGVTAVTFTDDIKHTYKAVERSGRVASTLAVCINEYVCQKSACGTSLTL